MKNVSFFCPIFLGHPKARAAASKAKGGTGKAEAAGRRNYPEAHGNERQKGENLRELRENASEPQAGEWWYRDRTEFCA